LIFWVSGVVFCSDTGRWYLAIVFGAFVGWPFPC